MYPFYQILPETNNLRPGSFLQIGGTQLLSFNGVTDQVTLLVAQGRVKDGPTGKGSQGGICQVDHEGTLFGLPEENLEFYFF